MQETLVQPFQSYPVRCKFSLINYKFVLLNFHRTIIYENLFRIAEGPLEYRDGFLPGRRLNIHLFNAQNIEYLISENIRFLVTKPKWNLFHFLEFTHLFITSSNKYLKVNKIDSNFKIIQCILFEILHFPNPEIFKSMNTLLKVFCKGR